eukprot:IDg16954t1
MPAVEDSHSRSTHQGFRLFKGCQADKSERADDLGRLARAYFDPSYSQDDKDTRVLGTVISNGSHLYRRTFLVYKLNVVDLVKDSVIVIPNSGFSVPVIWSKFLRAP